MLNGDKTVSSYYGNTNPDLLRIIPQNAKIVVEFGCGEGNLGATYKTYNPDCIYCGVELFDDAAEKAREKLDRVLVTNIDSLTLPELLEGLSLKKGEVDCIVYGDVIEHLTDPWKALEQHAKLLKKDGIIASCIPNIAHWSIIRQLIHGQWTYSDDGLLDRTHLRFFSESTVRDLFDSLGMAMVTRSNRLLGDEKEHSVFFQHLRPLIQAQETGLTEQQSYFATRTFQFITAAQRTASIAPHALNISSMMLKPVGAVNDLRIIEPHYFLSSLPHVNATQQIQTMTLLPTPRPKNELRLFIWHRPIMSYAQAIPHLKTLLDNDYLIVVEFDDDLDHWPLAKQEKYLTLTGCHAVQTTNNTLASCFRKHNPEVGVFPNQIAQIPPKPKFNDGAPLHIFFGAIGREDDWAPLLPSIKAMIKRYKNKLHFHIIHDQKLFDALNTKTKSFTPLCDYNKYKEILRSCDIALLPLEDTRFNQMKSDLKFIECGAHCTAALASPVIYADVIQHQKNGLIYNSVDEFETLFTKLVDEKNFRKKLVDNAYDYVKSERSLARHFMTRYEWYMSLFERKDELTQALLERVPELKP